MCLAVKLQLALMQHVAGGRFANGANANVPFCGSYACARYYHVGSSACTSHLTNHGWYPNSPQYTQGISSGNFETINGYGDNYGARLEGYFMAPWTGNYRFWVWADDGSKVWAYDHNGGHHEVVSYDCSCCQGILGGTNLYYYASHQYFIYGVMKEGGGGDWLRIGVYAPNGGAYYPMPISWFIPRCDTVSFSPNGGTNDIASTSVTISMDSRRRCSVYYHQHHRRRTPATYSSSFSASNTGTGAVSYQLLAYGYYGGWSTSTAVYSNQYTLKARVSAPGFSPHGGTNSDRATSLYVSWYSSSGGASYRYYDQGSTPNWNAGTSASSVTWSNTGTGALTKHLRVIGWRSGWSQSSVNYAVYTIKARVSTPGFAPNGGTNSDRTNQFYTSWSSSSGGATIRYIINGGNPTYNSGSVGTSYNFVNNGQSPLYYTIRAIGYRSGWSDSAIATSATYTLKARVATPYFSPNGGVNSDRATTLTAYFSTSTSGASIRYTINGANPAYNSGSTAGQSGSYTWTTSLDTVQTYTLRVIAYRSGWSDSVIATSAVYTIKARVSMPGFAPITL